MTADAPLAGRTVLITGANTGIGRATAAGLADRGARLVLACRSEAKALPVIDEIRSATGNDDVAYLHLDLADLASVRGTARALLDRGDPIAVLIANAGVAGQRGQTAQGFELAFGINHLGHFLLVTELVPLLRAAAPARVVVVSSDSHYQAEGIEEADVRGPTRSITGLPEYARSKLANVLFAQELARRLPPGEVAAHSLHPGVVATDIWRRVPGLVRPLMTFWMRSATKGAETSIWCATSTELDGRSGRFYTDCAEKEPSPVATPELAAWLWERSEAWVAGA